MPSSFSFIRPIIFNVFCSWAVALASFFTSVSILRKRKRDKEAISFALFWLFVGFIFVAIGSYSLFLPKINKSIIYLGQVFIGFVFVPLSYYLSHRIWGREKVSRKIAIFNFIFFLFWILLVFSVKFPEPVFSDWGVAFRTPLMPMIFFQVLFILPNFLFLAYVIFTQIVNWLKNKKIIDIYNFFATFSIVLIFSAGYFDERGLNAGWQLFLIRELELVAALMAYLCYTGSKPEKEA